MQKIYKITEYVAHLTSSDKLHLLYRDYAFRYRCFDNYHKPSFKYPISYSQARKGDYKILEDDKVRNIFYALGFYLDKEI